MMNNNNYNNNNATNHHRRFSNNSNNNNHPHHRSSMSSYPPNNAPHQQQHQQLSHHPIPQQQNSYAPPTQILMVGNPGTGGFMPAPSAGQHIQFVYQPMQYPMMMYDGNGQQFPVAMSVPSAPTAGGSIQAYGMPMVLPQATPMQPMPGQRLQTPSVSHLQPQPQQRNRNQQQYRRNHNQPFGTHKQQQEKHILTLKDPETNEEVDVPRQPPQKQQAPRQDKPKEDAIKNLFDKVRMCATDDGSEGKTQELKEMVNSSVIFEQSHYERGAGIGDAGRSDTIVNELSQCEELYDAESKDNDPANRIYSRKYLLTIRDMVKKAGGDFPFQGLPFQLSDDGIEQLGLKEGTPRPRATAAPKLPKPEREKHRSGKFDAPCSNEFKTAWQNTTADAGPPAGAAQGSSTVDEWRQEHSVEVEKRGDQFPARPPPPYHGRNSDGKATRKTNVSQHQQYAGRPSIDRSYRKHGQHQQNSSSPPHRLPFRSRSPQLIPKEQCQQQSSEGKEETPARQPSPPAAKVWKPRRRQEGANVADAETLKREKICKEIRGILNKITPSTYDDLVKEFCSYKVYEDLSLLPLVINLIFEKAVEEPKFCPLYSDLCKKQVDVQVETLKAQMKTEEIKNSLKTFMLGIIATTQSTFEESSVSDAKVKALKEKKIGDGVTEQERQALDEEIEALRSKDKRRLLGIIKFVAQLFRLNILPHYIINYCFARLMGRFNEIEDETYVEYMAELLEAVGGVYADRMMEAEQKQKKLVAEKPSRLPAKPFTFCAAAEVKVPKEEKKNTSDWVKEMSLPLLMDSLTVMENNLKLSHRVRFKIMNLDELRNNKWVPRGGDQGPKTIDEVREEAEREQQNNEAERLKYELQKEQEREMRQQERQQRGPFPRPPHLYQGRNSLPNARRTAAPSHSSNSAVGGGTLPRDDAGGKNQRFRTTNLTNVDQPGLKHKKWDQQRMEIQEEKGWRQGDGGKPTAGEVGDAAKQKETTIKLLKRGERSGGDGGASPSGDNVSSGR